MQNGASEEDIIIDRTCLVFERDEASKAAERAARVLQKTREAGRGAGPGGNQTSRCLRDAHAARTCS